MWEQLQDKLQIEDTSCPGYRLVPKPTNKTLDQFENTHSVKLPASYREFVLTFGAGELAEFYRIAAPLDIECDYDLDRFNRQIHGDPEEKLLAVYGPPNVIDKFLFFCSTGGGAFFGWKLNEVTSAASHDYAIYEFPGFPPFQKVADAFQDFILRHILEPDPRRKWTPKKVFSRFQVEE